MKAKQIIRWGGGILAVLFLSAALLPGAIRADHKASESDMGKAVPTTRKEEKRVEAELRKVEKLCRACYLSAEKVPSAYIGQEDIGQRDIDAMEDALCGAGYCVVNSDAAYPEYLENADALRRFWDDVTQSRDAAVSVWNIFSDGSVCCRELRYAEEKGCCLHASAGWDENGALQLSDLEKREVLYWDMTASGFLYQDVYRNAHWNAAELLRLAPSDHRLYELTEKYITPIGYQSVNMFLVDWDSEDFAYLSFNDLLSGLYRMQYGDCLYARDYPYEVTPYPHSLIPAALFESVVLPHFDISLQEFRARALYDAGTDSYPWQDLDCGNMQYYPDLIPELTEARENTDGTTTLFVNVICPDLHTDRLFTHELTLRIAPDGGFQYLANHLSFRSGIELPSPQPRIEARRFRVE